MIINRQWAMPNKWTFTIPPIKKLLKKYVEGHWADPFAGQCSPASITNDINPETNALFHQDALEFLQTLSNESYDGVLFDPPYSITQAQQCYKSFSKEKLKVTPSNMAYWKGVKDQMNRIIKPRGLAICCGWSSQGLGVNRGFEMLEILLVPHGGSKNDTIVTVERKIKKPTAK